MEEPDAALEAKALAAALAALAHPTRILVLSRLRTPRLLSEIHVRGVGDETPHGPPLARQTIKNHLDKLVEAGFAVATETDRDGRASAEYLVNHSLLYAYAERFRDLARLAPSHDPRLATLPAASADARGRLAPPCLVLVKGLGEGRAWRLDPPPHGAREWLIGRKRGLPVSLDYDPFVSSENALVAWRDGRHVLQDLPESRNGTTLNFEPLPRGGEAALANGDVIGVGRSLLLFKG